MRRLLCAAAALLIIIFSTFSVSAADNVTDKIADTEIITQALPDDAKKSLSDIGINSVDPKILSGISFTDIINELFKTSSEQLREPLAVLAAVVAAMLLYSLLYGLRSSVNSYSMQSVISLCTTLCIVCLTSVPVVSVINASVDTVGNVSRFMLAYLPVMVGVLSASGQAVSGSAYYSMVMLAAQGVTAMSSTVAAPLMQTLLGLGVSSAVNPMVNLSGILRTVTKLLKWIVGIVMTIFTAVLSLRQLVAVNLDGVSVRALRFALGSAVPVVGSALSEALRTVQGSVSLLKSGIGVFAIIAAAVIFLPVILRCLFWSAALKIALSVGEIIGLRESCVLLENISAVLSLLIAVLLSLAAVFIISTAALLLIGGGSG